MADDGDGRLVLARRARRVTAALVVVWLTAACSAAPAPEVPSEERTRPLGARAKSERRPDQSDAGVGQPPGDAGTEAADAGDAAGEPVYREPAPVVVRRHHVYCTLFARAGKRVTLTSLLTTASDGEPTLAPGTEAVLQHKPKGATDWVAVAKAKVVSIADKGNRAASTERREIVVQLLSEEPGHKSAFARSAKVRLEVDRPVEN